MWIDTHAHLNDERLYPEADAVVQRACQAGVERIVNVAFDLASARLGLEIAKCFDQVHTAVGIHPHDAETFTQEAEDELRRLADHPKVVAYGEIGLDYHYDRSPRDVQRQAFIRQIHLAGELDLPIIIHNRESHGDMLEILKAHPPKAGGVMHCFSGSVEFMQECVRLGLYISLAGPVTFKNARKLPEVARQVPLERLMVETDCPYLTPEPHRGTTNEPSRVVLVGRRIAQLRTMEVERLADATRANSLRFFRITP